MQLDHIGILVTDIESVTQDFVHRWDCVIVDEIIEDQIQQARVLFLDMSNCRIELIAPDSPSSHLARQSCGLHHLCFRVPSIKRAARKLQAGGMLAIAKPTSAPALGGRLIAWFADRAGLLIELVEGNK